MISLKTWTVRPVYHDKIETWKGKKFTQENNVPACVLVKPEQYDAMMEALEDYALYVEAQKREEAHAQEPALSSNATKELLGIPADALANIEVDLE